MVLVYIWLVVAIILLCAVSLVHGSVDIPLTNVYAILCGDDGQRESWKYIVVENRLPQMLTALLAGGALAVSGLLLQTVFRNPLAAPDIFGITSGASLAAVSYTHLTLPTTERV